MCEWYEKRARRGRLVGEEIRYDQVNNQCYSASQQREDRTGGRVLMKRRKGWSININSFLLWREATGRSVQVREETHIVSRNP